MLAVVSVLVIPSIAYLIHQVEATKYNRYLSHPNNQYVYRNALDGLIVHVCHSSARGYDILMSPN